MRVGASNASGCNTHEEHEVYLFIIFPNFVSYQQFLIQLFISYDSSVTVRCGVLICFKSY